MLFDSSFQPKFWAHTYKDTSTMKTYRINHIAYHEKVATLNEIIFSYKNILMIIKACLRASPVFYRDIWCATLTPSSLSSSIFITYWTRCSIAPLYDIMVKKMRNFCHYTNYYNKMCYLHYYQIVTVLNTSIWYLYSCKHESPLSPT